MTSLFEGIKDSLVLMGHKTSYNSVFHTSFVIEYKM